MASGWQEGLLNADLWPHPNGQNPVDLISILKRPPEDWYEYWVLLDQRQVKISGSWESKVDMWPSLCLCPHLYLQDQLTGRGCLKHHLEQGGARLRCQKFEVTSFIVYNRDKWKFHTIKAHHQDLISSQAILTIFLGVRPTSTCYSVKSPLTPVPAPDPSESWFMNNR